MTMLKSIIKNFSDVGIDVDNEVATRCIQLCSKYGLNENEIVDQWLAFSVSSEDDSISIEKLNLMEKKELLKSCNVENFPNVRASPAADAKVYKNELMDIDVRNCYDNNTHENILNENGNNPVSANSKDTRFKYNVRSPRALFSPTSFSPASYANSKKYADRTNSGNIVCRFGMDVDLESWKTFLYETHDIKIDDEFTPIPCNVRFMFETTNDRIQTSKKLIESVCAQIAESHDIKFSEEINQISMEKTTYAGRIICDSNGKLNTSSILLESCVLNKRIRNIKLQMSEVPEYSLFPGQIVLVEGKNPVGDKIIAEKIHTDVLLSKCPAPKIFLNPTTPLKLIVSAGPYTLSNTLSYQPLFDLRDYVLQHKPHVVILIGPIIDCLHPNVVDNSINIPFSDFYFSLIKDFVNAIKNEKIHTEVVVVSNWREAGHKNLYPTPAVVPRKEFNYPNLTFVPDPCVLNISGFLIGVTSTDILMHLGKEELFCSTVGPGLDRLGRLASHIFQQRNFYPLFPAAEEMTVDLTLTSEYAQIPYIPHMIILPSDLRYFIKNIKGCIVVNPEKLSKGMIGGNFARIEVRSVSGDETWTTETHVTVQIVKI